jgi:hypothetical protein
MDTDFGGLVLRVTGLEVRELLREFAAPLRVDGLLHRAGGQRHMM